MFKKITIMLILALLVTTAGARDYGQTYHEIQVVDELGRNVTDITNLYIFAPGTTTDAVIYSDRNRQNVITIPMVEGGPNSTLVDGLASWWGPDGYDFSMTNDSAVGPEGNYGHLPRTGSDGTIMFPSFLHAISTAAYLDGESITMGDGLDWVINGGGVADTLSFTPASDDADFIVGSVDPAESASMFVYISATEGWFIDSSVPSASWTGGTLNCNVSSNYATNINTGTSTGIIHIGDGTGTGAINIGNSAGGIITLDTDESISITADTTFAVTNTTGDQTYTTASSFNIVASEAATDAVNIDVGGANGGFDLDTTNGPIALTTAGAANGDMTLTVADKFTLISTDAQAAGIDIEENGGVNGTIHLHANQGTSQSSIDLISDGGGVKMTSSSLVDTQYAVQISSAMGAIQSQGSALYASTAVTGNVDGPTYNLGSWLDITAGTPTAAALFVGVEAGVYVSATPTMTSADIAILQLQYMGDDASTCDIVAMIRVNSLLAGSGGEAPDYFIWAGNDEAICFTPDATTGATKVGAIKINSAQSGTMYIWTYDSTGS